MTFVRFYFPSFFVIVFFVRRRIVATTAAYLSPDAEICCPNFHIARAYLRHVEGTITIQNCVFPRGRLDATGGITVFCY